MLFFLENNEKSKCVGCRNCENMCSLHCISMEYNEEGFLYPIIDNDKCIRCGKCSKACPVLADNYENEKSDFYAAWIKDENIRRKSSSGGAFSAISNYIFAHHGYVFGTIYDEQFNVIFDYTNDQNEVSRFCGSKYVSSNLRNTFFKVKELVLDNQLCLFVGLPCQIAALYSFLEKDYHNLITVDLICHGVPSAVVFKKYLRYLENKIGRSVEAISFRGKNKRAYSPNGFVIKTRKHKFMINSGLSKYFNAFISGKLYRESCYACEYRYPHRPGDFSIGDFWGAGDLIDKCEPEKGISLIMVNTEKARTILESMENLELIKMNLNNAIYKNSALIADEAYPEDRKEIYDHLLVDFQHGLDRYFSPNLFRCFYDSVLSNRNKTRLIKLKHRLFRINSENNLKHLHDKENL